jgi:tRNA U34 5-carboxymethylaminomethyl modifying GTPase MnmE/TrmE
MHNIDTIIALSTPVGRGAIAVIRISGSNTTQILKQIIQKPSSKEKIDEEYLFKNARKFLRAIISFNDEIIDDGMIVFFSIALYLYWRRHGRNPYSWQSIDSKKNHQCC